MKTYHASEPVRPHSKLPQDAGGDLHLYLFRDTFTMVSTVGKLYANEEFFCHTLEDVSRGAHVKISGETCIPPGTYHVKVSMSSRFKRRMPMIYSETNGYELKALGISFKGIRMHGGNTHRDTAGCPLVAYNRLSDTKIQGTAEKDLTALIDRYGGEALITVVNHAKNT